MEKLMDSKMVVLLFYQLITIATLRRDALEMFDAPHLQREARQGECHKNA